MTETASKPLLVVRHVPWEGVLLDLDGFKAINDELTDSAGGDSADPLVGWSAMNHKQRQRRSVRRSRHQTATAEDRPALILKQDGYPEVKRSHIVPRCYQEAWAIRGRVMVHLVGEGVDQAREVTMKITHAGTRRRYYRRRRPDGTSIDDTEASLAFLEGRAAPALRRALRTIAPLDLVDKGGLAQLVGAQMVRGPRFFEQREDLVAGWAEQLSSDDFTAAAVRDGEGDLGAMQARALQTSTDATQAHLTMLTTAIKLGMLLANMRWELLTFDAPCLVYCDHPVVVWQGLGGLRAPTAQQTLAPLDAAEVLMPLGPQLLLVANWVDRPDPAPAPADETIAAQANAFVVAQAERQWMHRLDARCPLGEGSFAPVTSQRTPGYDTRSVLASARRAFAAGELERNRGRRHLRDLRVLDI